MIDYGRIDRAVRFYEARGYRRIETPWLVSKPIAEITKPGDRPHYVVKRDTQDMEKSFVASGEQGFLYLINKGHLPAKGKFQTVTPCIRADAFGIWHTKYFVKLELIVYDTDADVGLAECEDVMDDAQKFFERESAKPSVTVTGPSSWDLDHNNIELGSYGIRKTSFVSWIYGTGLAEPRFTRALKQKEPLYG